MFKCRTVFVLGAGASRDLGFPLGWGLLERIVSLAEMACGKSPTIPNATAVMNAIHNAVFVNTRATFQQICEAATKIINEAPKHASIDDFLHAHSSDKTLQITGKALVCYAIAEAEYASIIGPGSLATMPVEAALTDKFYGKLFALLASGWSPSDQARCLNAAHNNLTIVTFNYDRALERSVSLLAARDFGISEKEAVTASIDLDVIHVYGMVGSLPHQSDQEFQPQPYGQPESLTPNPNLQVSLGQFARLVRTYNESASDKTIDRVRNAIQRAERICLVGCAPHRQNMEFLFGGVSYDSSPEIFMTAIGVPAPERKAAEAYLKASGARKVDIRDSWTSENILRDVYP